MHTLLGSEAFIVLVYTEKHIYFYYSLISIIAQLINFRGKKDNPLLDPLFSRHEVIETHIFAQEEGEARNTCGGCNTYNNLNLLGVRPLLGEHGGRLHWI